jgi:2-aminoadipate transaminase
MFIFARLPSGQSALDILPRALDEGVAFVPGHEFFIDATGTETFRLNFTHSSAEQILRGMKILGEIIGCDRHRGTTDITKNRFSCYP